MNSKKRHKAFAAGLGTCIGSLTVVCRYGIHTWTLVGIAVGVAVGGLILIARRRA